MTGLPRYEFSVLYNFASSPSAVVKKETEETGRSSDSPTLDDEAALELQQWEAKREKERKAEKDRILREMKKRREAKDREEEKRRRATAPITTDTVSSRATPIIKIKNIRNTHVFSPQTVETSYV